MQHIKKIKLIKVISQSPGISLCLAFGHRQMKLKIDVTRNKIK